MKPLTLEEIARIEEYEPLREAYRAAIIAHKKPRRVAVGDKVTLVFEDRETLRFQVQEMLRIERTTRPEDVQHELDTYNELLPGERELSATLFVEITESGRIRPELDRLVGIDEHVFLRLGSGDASARVHAAFDAKQLEDDRISAVQYLRFSLDPAQAERFADPAEPAAIEIDHAHYRARCELTGETRRSLVATSRGECPELLIRSGAEGGGAASEYGGERVRVRDAGGGVVIVEAREPSARLESADPNLAAELWQALQQVVAALVRADQRCEISVRAGHDVEGVRFEIRPR